MLPTANKVPLDLNQYDKYSIPQEYSAFTVFFVNISQEQSDEFESSYSTQGYKIFHSDLTRSVSGLFDLEIIIAKCEIIF